MFKWIARLLRRQVAKPSAPARIAAPEAHEKLPDPWDEWLALLDVPASTAEPPDLIALARLEQLVLHELDTRSISLPSFPPAAAQVFELVEQPHVDLNKLVTVLHREPAIATEVMRVASSAKYNRGDVDDLRSAVLLLGITEVSSIATGVAAASLFTVESRVVFELFPEAWQQAYREALVVAFAASWLAAARSVTRHDRVFLRAILDGASRTAALRALAGLVLDGAIETPAPDALLLVIDAVAPEASTITRKHWVLPPTLLDDDARREVERDIVATATAAVELRRTVWKEQGIVKFRKTSRVLGLDDAWVRVLMREVDAIEKRVADMMVGAPATAAA